MKTTHLKSSLITSLLISSSIFFTQSNAFAEFTQSKCEYTLQGSGAIQINRRWNEESGICYISIHPRNAWVDLKYRDYYFDNTGHFMVFNSYGEGEQPEMSGARDYYLFPITENYPDYSIESNGDVIVKMVSGHQIRISSKDFSVVSFTPGSFIEKPLSQKNKGGLEIVPHQGFWLDGGFQLGNSPLGNPNGKTVVKSSKASASCQVINKDYLVYDSDSDYQFKYQGVDFISYLKKKCPLVPLSK